MTISHFDRCPACGYESERRSNKQNALYWALLHEISERIRVGTIYGADTWHIYFRSRFLGCDDVRLPNGKTMALPKSTADLDVAEFSEYLTKVEAFAAERGVWLATLGA